MGLHPAYRDRSAVLRPTDPHGHQATAHAVGAHVIRHNSKVLVINWPDGSVEVTQVIAPSVAKIAVARGANVVVVKVQDSMPKSLK